MIEPSLAASIWDGASGSSSGWVNFGTTTHETIGDALKITYGNSASGAYIYLRNASQLNTDLTVGKIYRINFDTKVTSGSVEWKLQVTGGGTSFVAPQTNSTTYVNLSFYIVAESTTLHYFFPRQIDNASAVFIKNIKVEEVQGVAGAMTNMSEADITNDVPS